MVVPRVAQAAVRVSDLWFTFKTRRVESITDEVADCLADKKLPFTRVEKLAMPNRYNLNNQTVLLYGIDNPVVALTDSIGLQ